MVSGGEVSLRRLLIVSISLCAQTRMESSDIRVNSGVSNSPSRSSPLVVSKCVHTPSFPFNTAKAHQSTPASIRPQYLPFKALLSRFHRHFDYPANLGAAF